MLSCGEHEISYIISEPFPLMILTSLFHSLMSCVEMANVINKP